MSVVSLTLCELNDTGVANVESYSPFCFKIHRSLKYLRLPYTRRHAGNPAGHKAHNETGQVPVLLVGNKPVADSTNILHCLISMGHTSLNPFADPALQAEAWLWEEFGDSTLNAFLVASRWADDENWERVKDAYFGGMPSLLKPILLPRIRKKVLQALVAREIWRRSPEDCWSRLELLLDQLNARVKPEGYWVGDRLSVADLSIFAQLQSLRTDLTPRQRGWVESRTRLRTWLDRIERETRGG
jgi:glutathione S-transferase